MSVTGEELIKAFGSTYEAAAADLDSRVGDQSELHLGESWWGFPKAGFMYLLESDGSAGGLWMPSQAGTVCTVPLPFGLTLGAARSEVHALLGAPAESPSIPWYQGPSDIFDLDSCSAHVCYDEAEKVVVCYFESPSAPSVATARAQRAKLRYRTTPEAAAAALAALVARISRFPRRDQAKPTVAELLEAAVPAELRALLEAQAHHDFARARVGDFRLDDTVSEDEVPAPGANADEWTTRTDRLVIGRSGGGDLWVVDWPPLPETRVLRLVHDEDWREEVVAPSLGRFLADQTAADED